MGLLNIFDSDKMGQNDNIISLADRPSQDEINRYENIQIAVAVAIISAFLTSTTTTRGVLNSSEEYLQILATIAILFLSAKLILVTVRPFGDFPVLLVIDNLVLSFVFLFSLLSMLIVTGALIVEADISDIIPITNNSVTAIVVLVIGGVSGVYSAKVGNTMSQAEISMPEHSLTVTSGSSGTALPLTLRNTTKRTLAPEDIELVVSAPDLVEVVIEPAHEVDSGVWQPLVPIKPDSQTEIDVRFIRSKNKEEISREEVTITVRVEGKTIESHIATLKI